MNLSGEWGTVKYSFTIYKNKEYIKGDNLISTCFFMLKEITPKYAKIRLKTLNELKEGHSEKVKRYTDGLKKLIAKTKTKNVDNITYTIRVYCDITTFEYLKQYLIYKNIELYLYHFPQFFDKKMNCHFGFFGTLMRYFPLFKLENHNNGEWNTTTVLDLDLHFRKEFKVMKYYLNKISSKDTVNILFQSYRCYFLLQRMINIKLNPPYITICSSFIIQKTPQDFAIFKYFLENLLKEKYNNYNNLVKTYINNGSRYEYGVDEYFINKLFLQKMYIEKNKSLYEVFRKETGGVKILVDYLNDYEGKFQNEGLIKKLLYNIVKYYFPFNYKIIPYKNIKEFIQNIKDAIRELNPKYISEKRYKKLYDIISKLDFEKLNLPKIFNSLFPHCISRTIQLNNNNDVNILLVSPNPTYPNFTEKIVAGFK